MVVLLSFFEHVFKFSPLQFSEGELGFQVGRAIIFVGLLFLMAAAIIGAVYYAAKIYRSNRSKAFSLSLRLTALLLLCLPLLEPVLIVPDVAPRENFVAVVVDGSQSMEIPDGLEGTDRLADARHLLYEQQGGLVDRLREDFQLRYYTFSDRAVRTDSITAERSEGRRTNLSATLNQVVSDFQGIPLAGIVLLTDGSDNSSDSPQEVAEQLQSRDIPLHIVGLGRETHENDRELIEAAVSKHVEEETGAEIDLTVQSWQTESEEATFSLYRDDELVFTENRRLSGGGTIDRFSFFYEPDESGARKYTVHVSEAPGEINTENNTQPLLIDTRSDTSRVLYVEGHPRYEFKYIKRTLENDPSIEFVSIMRTGSGRFYRQGIDDPDQLTGGFADSAEELNSYKAVIFGNIEASSFTPEQLQMVERFVRTRGGGVLMLGGMNTLQGGNYQNTPIADLLPVTLPENRRRGPYEASDESSLPDSLQGYTFAPTAAGLDHTILKLSPDPSVNRARWEDLPRLRTIYPVGDVKPGAEMMARALREDSEEGHPAMVLQRYGKGRSMVLPTAGTWRWQMKLPAEDARHQRFWRQLIRWLVASAPDRVDLSISQNRVSPGDAVPIQTYLYDEEYRPLDEATVEGTVVDPDGREHSIELERNLLEPGLYETSFPAESPGVYELAVRGQTDAGLLGTDQVPFLVRHSQREFQDAALKKEFLQDLAEVSGGFYYDPPASDQLPTNLVTRETSRSIYHIDYLWDMPFLFALAVLLLSIEWVYRRRRGLP